MKPICSAFATVVGRSLHTSMLVAAVSSVSVAVAQDKDEKKTPDGDKPKKITYAEHIEPIFRAKCFTCHKEDKKSSGLNLTNYSAVMEGGSAGEAVEPGNPDDSWLYLLVTHQEQPHMPPKSEKLPDAQLNLIRLWIEQGALENASSKSTLPNKPKVDFSLKSASVGKPEGPPPMPEGLLLEPVVRAPRTTAITAIATSPWAPLVAVAGQKQILLYNSDTLDLAGVLPFPEGIAQVLKFSRNGSLLLAGGGRGAHSGKVVVWDVRKGERIFAIGDELDVVLAADISSDQSKIALGGPSKVVRVYATSSGEKLYEITKHTNWVFSLEFSPDGVLLATADRNGGMFVWEAHTGREYANLRGHGGPITDLSWRIDSNLLASGSEDGSIRLWEMENGRQVRSWGAHGGGAQSIEFTRDGRIASCGRDRVTKMWDQAGKQLRAFEAFSDVALRTTFNHDGSKIITGDWTGEVRVWATADGKRLGNLNSNPPTIKERIASVKQQLQSRQGEHQKALTAAQQVKQQAAGIQKQLDNARANIAQTQQLIKTTTASLTSEQKKLAAARQNQTNLLAVVKAQTDTLQKLTQVSAEVSKLAAAESNNPTLKESASKVAQASEALKKDVTAKTVQSQGIQQEVARAEGAIKKLTGELAAANQKLNQIKNLPSEISAKLQDMNKKVTAADQVVSQHATVVAQVAETLKKWETALADATAKSSGESG